VPNQKPRNLQKPGPKLFYGHIVVVAAFFIMAISWGAYNTFGMFFNAVLKEFGWSRAMTSGAFSITWVMSGLLRLVTGRLNDTRGPRIVVTMAGLSLGLGFLLMSRISTIWQLYIFYGLLIGVGMAGILVAGPFSDLIGNKIPIAITFILRFFLFLLILKYQNLISFYIFTLAFGFTFAITAPLSPILIGRLYGFSHLGVLSGFMSTAHHLGGGLWAYVGGVIFDQTGSYRLAFILSAAMALVAVMSTLFINESDHRGSLFHREGLLS
jgi:MFS family permease